MASRTDFQGLKEGGDRPENVARAVNQLLLGKLNCTLAVTLRASNTTTVLSDPRINATTVFLFDPRTPHAATEIYGATMYVSAVSKGSATITHANNAQTDRTFAAALFA